MSESKLVSDLRLTAQGGGQSHTRDSAALTTSGSHLETASSASPSLDQLQNGSRSSPSPSSPHNATLPLDELTAEALATGDQAQYYLRHVLERVQSLERALDQTLASYDDLRARMQDQAFLEQQLAATEEYSHLQQHEIERLRQQLREQQPQQVSILEAKLRMAWDRIANLEAQLEDAQQHIARLCEQLSNQHMIGAKSSPHGGSTPLGSANSQGLPNSHPAPMGSSTIASLLQELLKAQARIKTLEAYTAEQEKHQEVMQQAYQELEAEHLAVRSNLANYDPEHIRQVERQVSELQEQILMQEHQAEEYEAAVQHWKDRYLASCCQAQRLKELITQQVPNLPPELAALMDEIQPANLDELAQPALLSLKSGTLKRKSKVDLPEFLTRSRSKSRTKP
ncbi:MAG: hypothetical protein NZ772_16580 [Cyanobacteria bacterium]|nr:hypothetical protein [Cyanobacteriota bacterium]MDW8202946.1 hypothetical protein [Cyanobacteriota bacterium SKYGB_h_bin112]